MSPLILLIHVGATCAMVGLIWFVQLVHYPLMASVPPEQFRAFALAHQRRTTWVVGPLMLAETITATLIAFGGAATISPALCFGGVALLAIIWASTLLVQVPLHQRLAQAFTTRDHALLVKTNWVRTTLWTARGGMAVMMLV